MLSKIVITVEGPLRISPLPKVYKNKLIFAYKLWKYLYKQSVKLFSRSIFSYFTAFPFGPAVSKFKAYTQTTIQFYI